MTIKIVMMTNWFVTMTIWFVMMINILSLWQNDFVVMINICHDDKSITIIMTKSLTVASSVWLVEPGGTPNEEHPTVHKWQLRMSSVLDEEQHCRACDRSSSDRPQCINQQYIIVRSERRSAVVKLRSHWSSSVHCLCMIGRTVLSAWSAAWNEEQWANGSCSS